jgi:hypothetical protein
MTSISHACGRRVAVLFGLLVCTCPAPGRAQDQANTTERKVTVGTILSLQDFKIPGECLSRGECPKRSPESGFRTPPPQYQSQSNASGAVRCLTQQCKPLVYFGYKALPVSRNSALDREAAPFFAEHARSLVAIVIAAGAAAFGLGKRIGRGFRRP